jgi:hypothetical protein
MVDLLSGPLLVLHSFFRIHFARNEEILEDLLPKIGKIDPARPLPGSIKSILESSGPSVVLLNRILTNPADHYRPTSPAIQSRAAELSEFLDIVSSTHDFFPSTIDFLSLMAAFVNFHRKETNYHELFDFMLRLCKETHLVKKLAFLARPRCLHYAMPYEPGENESSDSDFGFNDEMEVPKKKAKSEETPEAVISKVSEVDGKRGQLALNLFLGGLISRDELSAIAPSTKGMAIGGGARRSLVQSEATPTLPRSSLPAVGFSYVSAPAVIAFKPFTGALVQDEFVLNRELISVFRPLGGPDTTKTHPDVDGECCDGFVTASAESLSALEIDAEIMLAGLLDLSRGEVTPFVDQSISDLYGIMSEEIFNYVKIAPTPPAPVVAAMRASLFRYAVKHYDILRTAYLHLTQTAVRGFPAPELIPNAIAYLRERLPDPEAVSLQVKVGELLADFRSRLDLPFPMPFLDILLLTRFSKFYKLWVRHFFPELCMQGNELTDRSGDWAAIWDSRIAKAIDALGLTEVDAAMRLDRPALASALERGVQKMATLGYPVDNTSTFPTRLVAFNLRSGNLLSLDILRLIA